jgi:hypothetical protein
MTSRYKGRSGFKEIARLYPCVVEILVPRPKRFELLTPRFVDCCVLLFLKHFLAK